MALISANRRRYHGNEQVGRRSSSAQKQTAMRTAVPARNGFLNHAFKPIVATAHKELSGKARVEKGFYTSLQHLASFYGFDTITALENVYPYNLFIAFEHAKKRMSVIDKSLQLKVIQEDNGKTAIAVCRTFDTGCQLNYIPVKPLHLLLSDKKRKATARLILSLFALLYRKGVAYHTDNFVGYHYDMILEWIGENSGEWNEPEYLQQLSACYAQQWHSAKIFKGIFHPYHSRRFGQYLNTYSPLSAWEQEIKDLCTQFHQLFDALPDAHFHRQIMPPDEHDEDCDLIYPEHYLSFFWTDDDSTYEQLMESVNNSLQDCSSSLDPVSMQLFDREQQKETHDFYFEWRFLLLIDHLCYLLYHIQ